MKRIATLASIALATLFTCGQAAAQTEPIVFVHGYSGSSISRPRQRSSSIRSDDETVDEAVSCGVTQARYRKPC